MKQIEIPTGSPKLYVTKYVTFRGVDMSTDPALIDNAHSPYAPNLISDSGGNPEKRLGWRTLCTATETGADGGAMTAPVNGIFRTVISAKAPTTDGEEETDPVELLPPEEFILVHAGTKLYRVEKSQSPDSGSEWELALLKENINNARSCGFTMKNRFYLLTGAEYLVFDGETVSSVSESAYVPTVMIGCTPAGDGTAYEDVNLLSPKRTQSFCADGTTKKYVLAAKGLDTTAVTAKKLDDTGDEPTWVDLVETTDFTVDREKGTVTFSTVPAKPAVTGRDNVEITYSKTVEGEADKICKCDRFALYGVGKNDRVFVAGNPDEPSVDWYSGLDDPTYFPDLGYSQIGTDQTAIMGYCRIGEYLGIIKQDNDQDATVFLRSANLVDGRAVFPVKQGITGVGAVSARAFGTLLDEPLFLARTGIYGITSTNVAQERTVQNRSYYVDAALTKEQGLENAVATVWDGYYVLAINGHCYILDGKQNKSYRPQSQGDYIYECYHWENVPAICFMEHDGELFFGTADGRICRFNTDRVTMDRYSDDGQAIVCYWSTKADDDGNFMMRKTIVKKGSGVMIKPYLRSSVKVTIRTDQDFGREV